MSLDPNPPPVKVNATNKDSFMHEFTENMTNVTCDGHCGFHAVPGLRDMFVDNY